MEDRPLADLFPPATRERWLGLVDGVLKGGDFEKRLVSKTADGIRIEPLYDPASPVAKVVTASFGVAAFQGTAGDDEVRLLRRADAALYDAKQTGRNRVCRAR